MDKFKNIVFGGGGLRCLSYIGALRALEEQGIIPHIKAYSGASAGAIFATMLSIGYTHAELKDFIKSFEYEYVRDIQIFGINENFGLDTGNKMERFLQLMIRRKTGKLELTFKEHYDLTKIKLFINSVCINDRTLHYFNVDTHPNMPIHVALRMSISLPPLISPIKWENKVYVDGGLLDNIPVSVFNTEQEQTLIIKIEKYEAQSQNIPDFETYCLAVIDCMFNELVRLKHKDINLDKYSIINIPHGGHSSFSFSIDKQQRKRLYRNGYTVSSTWLKKLKLQTPNAVDKGLVQSIVSEGIGEP